jgi:TetR/AcrR family transcriptional regulator
MKEDRATRQHVLEAALRKFAHGGYANTSVQDIVDAARVTKPTLYYYFENKADLYQALIDEAHDERLRLMQKAVAGGGSLAEMLIEVFTVLFEFAGKRRDLMRLACVAAFAAPGEIPHEIHYLEKAARNFEFIHSLIKKGMSEGVLDCTFSSTELTMSCYGLLNIYVMRQLVEPTEDLGRGAAERLIRLFLEGAAAKKR